MQRQAPWILADDTSGALEAGVAWREAGWRTLLPLSTTGGDGALPGPAPAIESLRSEPSSAILCSTESRNLPPDEAYRRVVAALRFCRNSGGALRFKKIDSTLRGPIAAELRAVVDTLHPRVLAFTPANPPVGRTVVDGELRVNGRTVDQTAFAKDPVCPVSHGRTAEYLSTAGWERVVVIPAASRTDRGTVVTAVREAARAGTVAIAGDAESTQDLADWVEAVRAADPRAVFVGSGALAQFVVEAHRPAAPLPEAPGGGKVVMLIGSKHEANRRQWQRFSAEAQVATCWLSAETGAFDRFAIERALDWGHVILALPPKLEAEPGAILAAFRAAVTWIHDAAGIGGIYATGGETARVVAEALKFTEFEVRGQLEPGVVTAVARGAGFACRTVIKPGGFGSDDIMARAWRFLSS